MSSDYDIVIIGGGLSGGSLALALQDTGYSVAVVEAVTDEQRHSSPAARRALALSYGTVNLLRSLGIWEGVAEKSSAIRDIHVSDRGHFAKARLSAEKEGVDALGYVITAGGLEDHISDILESSPIERICPARLMGFSAGPESVCLTLRRGEEDLTPVTRLLVGADGVQSSVRRFLNIGLETRDYRQTAIVTVIRPEVDPLGMAFERFTSTGPLAVLPMVDGCCSVVWTQAAEEAERIMALDDQKFRTRLQDAFGFRLGKLELESVRVQFPLELVRAETMIGPRSVLVGNAAHQLHPVAGQGFNLGIRDIALLAEMIIDDAGQCRDPGAPRLIEAYAEARRTDHEAVIRFTDGVVRVFSNDWLPAVGARGLGLLFLDHCSMAKHWLTRHAMGLGGRVPRIGSRPE